MESHRDYLRPARHDPRIAAPPVASAGPAAVKRHPAASSSTSLSRRQLIMLGAGTAAGALVGLSPQRAAAVLKPDVTPGHLQPLPIPIPDPPRVGLPD